MYFIYKLVNGTNGFLIANKALDKELAEYFGLILQSDIPAGFNPELPEDPRDYRRIIAAVGSFSAAVGDEVSATSFAAISSCYPETSGAVSLEYLFAVGDHF